MAIIDGLLKLDGSDGSLKKMTAAEENYIAHQAGLQLADAGVGEVGSITTTSSGNATVGTYTNTTMDGSVGGHDASSRNVTTTNTTIYQVEGTAATSGGSYFQPVIYDNSATKTLKVVNTTEMNVVVDRLLLSIFANDYAGTYQLASSAPSGDYSAHISNVFSDTRADGTTVNYSIWKRDTFTEPTKISPMRLLNSSGDLQAMSPAQIKYTFGQVAKNRIMNGSGGVGTYLLRSSSEGVPSATGTWVAKGTATDIRNTLADQNYTRDSTSNFEGNYTALGDGVGYQTYYQSTYSGDYAGDYTGNYAGGYVGNYDGSGNFQRNALENYATDYAGNFSGASSGFESNYVSNYGSDYTGDFTGDYDGQYTRASTTAYTTDYQTTSIVDYQRTRVSYTGAQCDWSQVQYYVGNYIGNFDGNFTFPYVSDYTGNYDGQYTRNDTTVFSSVYERAYQSNYVVDYEGTYEEHYTGDYIGNYDGGADYIGVYTGEYTGAYVGNFEGAFTSNYIANYIADYIGDYTGNFVGNYSGSTIQSGVQTIETYTLYVRTA